jgi:hypothetical protein
MQAVCTSRRQSQAKIIGAVNMPKLTKAQLTKKPAFGRLKKLLSKTDKRDLLWRYDIGRCAHSLVPSDNRAYGEGRIEHLAVALGKKENFGAILWATRSFYMKYDRPEVRVLCKPQNPGGFVLSWGHMIHLISLDDEVRTRFQEECLNAEWSCKELHRRIKESRVPQGQGGRHFRKPKSVEDALRQLVFESKTWDRRYREVWFELDEPAIRMATGKGKSEDVAELATEAVKVLKTLQSDIENCLPRLKALARKRKKPGRRVLKRR